MPHNTQKIIDDTLLSDEEEINFSEEAHDIIPLFSGDSQSNQKFREVTPKTLTYGYAWKDIGPKILCRRSVSIFSSQILAITVLKGGTKLRTSKVRGQLVVTLVIELVDV